MSPGLRKTKEIFDYGMELYRSMESGISWDGALRVTVNSMLRRHGGDSELRMAVRDVCDHICEMRFYGGHPEEAFRVRQKYVAEGFPIRLFGETYCGD